MTRDRYGVPLPTPGDDAADDDAADDDEPDVEADRRFGPEHLIRPFLDDPLAEPGSAVALPPEQGEVRPFLVTSGRTTGATDIPIETQVMVTSLGRTVLESLAFEYRDIVTACEEPLALAELAARLSLHLGVTRVLVGDLHHQGLVAAFEPDIDPADDVETIERMIDVLRTRF
ncbi:MAG TPA: DUF742 domain-containing protein [Kineosporiaceae bacterium]